MSKKVKTVTLKNGSICAVETLRDWLNWRIMAIRRDIRFYNEGNTGPIFNLDLEDLANQQGRLSELLIIRDQINDGRIEEIG